MSLSNLPEKFLINLCGKLDNKSLSKLALTSSQTYKLCIDVLENRRPIIIISYLSSKIYLSEIDQINIKDIYNNIGIVEGDYIFSYLRRIHLYEKSTRDIIYDIILLSKVPSSTRDNFILETFFKGIDIDIKQATDQEIISVLKDNTNKSVMYTLNGLYWYR